MINEQLTTFTETLNAYFATQNDVILAYLFGSQARGGATPLSDVDIAILLAPNLDKQQRFEKRLSIITSLTGRLQTERVDVIILNDAPLALSYRVLRDGILLHNAGEAARVRFTAEIVTRYLDFLPIIQRHEQAILERAGKGELLYGHDPHRGTLERYRQRRQGAAFIAESDV